LPKNLTVSRQVILAQYSAYHFKKHRAEYWGIMIRHTVVFNLKHPQNSSQEKAFLDAALRLASISSVRNFERLKQISPKNNFTFGLSMEFENKEGYDFYNNHPDHVEFVQKWWIPEVLSFLEIDYERLDQV
jgi:hypothetical protein